MKRILREARSGSGALSIIINGINLLPFAGLLLMFSTDMAAVAFGIIFLVLGLVMWTFSY